MEGTFLFLGTGASAGIPIIGCHCPVCSSHSVHNRRLRPSGLIKLKDKTFLIDVGPDFRQQALLHRIDHLDGLLLTHTHFDHIAGIDELRAYYFQSKKPLPCLLSEESLELLKQRYDYLFEPLQENGSLRAQFQFQALQDFGRVEFAGYSIDYLSYSQCGMKVTGFRIGPLAYISDIHDYDETVLLALKGVQKLIVSAIGSESSHAHFSVDEAVEFSRKIGAQRTWLTHISHHLDHDAAEHFLPPDIRMGYDGLEISF